MSKAVKYALLAEGPVNATDQELKVFIDLWNEYLSCLGACLPHAIVPIHKPHLVAMDPALPKVSGASEGLDQLMARVVRDTPDISAFVIAWDLTPPWDPDAAEEKYCRWNETKKLYAMLARSEALPDTWKASCAERSAELTARAEPKDRSQPFSLAQFAVIPMCMEPEFEGLLAQNEGHIMRALGLSKIPGKWWPKRWGASGQNPKALLQGAVVAARKARPKPGPSKRIRGDMRTAKHAWALHFLRFLLNNRRDLIDDHPLSQRVLETLR